MITLSTFPLNSDPKILMPQAAVSGHFFAITLWTVKSSKKPSLTLGVSLDKTVRASWVSEETRIIQSFPTVTE